MLGKMCVVSGNCFLKYVCIYSVRVIDVFLQVLVCLNPDIEMPHLRLGAVCI